MVVRAGNRDRIGSIGLEFDRIRTCLMRGVDDANCLLVILIMIRRELGNDVSWPTLANHASGDLKANCHQASRVCTKCSAICPQTDFRPLWMNPALANNFREASLSGF